jgi:hypothetical protein
MKQSEFLAPDIVSQRAEIDISSLPVTIIHLLARRAPNLIYGLDENKRKQLERYLNGLRDIGATNKLLARMLTGFSTGISVKCSRTDLLLMDLVGEKEIN